MRLYSFLPFLFLYSISQADYKSQYGVESVSEEGVYQYKEPNGETIRKKTPYGSVLAAPDGSYTYEELDADEEKSANTRSDILEIKADGTKMYKTEKSEQTGSFSLKGGSSQFNNFESDGLKFKDFYGESVVGVYFEIEKQYYTSLSRFGIKMNSGILNRSGSGRFKNGQTIQAKEKYNMFIIPLVVKAVIRFQFSDKQWFVPFIDGGLGAYGIAELRDDGDKSIFAYTPVATFGGGAMLQLDWLDDATIFKLDSDYGINHLWLTGEFQRLQSLKDTYDLSSNSVQFGFLFDF